MSEIKTKTILDGITLALRKEFPEYHIESEKVEQGLRPPAFIVRLVSSTQVRRVGNFWRRTPRFDVIFFPKNRSKEECYDIADDVSLLLSMIDLPTGDKLLGREIEHEVVDNVLHVLVSFPHDVFLAATNEPMENLKVTQGG